MKKPSAKKQSAILTSLLLLTAVIPGVSAQQVDSTWLLTKLKDVKGELKLVGIGATVLVDGSIMAEAVCGKRKQGADIELSLQDKWHLGSITKSMTATVIARLVEQDKLSFEMRLPELLPELADEIHPEWHKVSMIHLLTHSAGLPANFPVQTQFIRPGNRESLHDARRKEVVAVLSSAPEFEPGKKMVYSNVGYTLAGFIAAERSGISWEALMEQELFVPLNLTSAGFGPPVGDQPLDQPWGHQRALFFRSPADPNILADNSPIIGPAGIVHMSMQDLAMYGWQHLHGEQTNSSYLKSATFRKLHKAVMKDYAFGWIDWQRKWAEDRVLWHNGSNTFWYALVVLIPSRNAVIVIVTNDGYIAKAQPAFMSLAETITTALPAPE